MADPRSVRVVLFQVGDLACGVFAATAHEILPAQPATRIPGAPAAVVGLINVRGALLAVVDAHRLLARVPDPAHEGAILVLTVAGRRLGLAVGQVDDLLELPAADLESRASLPGVDARLVKAVGRRDDRHFVVLDTETLLAPLLGPLAGGERPLSRTA
jgi:purine-binding chemotaxis protein CheW